ncbi:MAG: response regulator [bacterium]
MRNILVACTDQTLCQTCRGELEGLGCSLHCVDTGQAALQYVHNHRVDLVIVHSDTLDKDCQQMLEVLRSFRPDVPIILTADQLDYWNDFRSWYADYCLIPTPKPREFRDRISDLLQLSSAKQEARPGNGFSVDWG